MTVVVDATGTKLITTVASASVNYTGITVGTGAKALVVTVACGAAVTAPNAHWDTAGANQAMTLISAVETSGACTTFMFGLRNPTAGLKTLNVAWTTSAKSNIEAISFTGAETTSDAKAFINANFASNAATVASIAIGLTSPADSIAVASYATTATFSSITQTNIFTDTTNTGCEGGASRANGAGASILFTGADTGTTGNKVIVGFVVAPPAPVLPPPLQEPVRSKIAGAFAIALMASGLFSAPLPPTGTVIADWPDFAKAKPRAIEVQPLPLGPFPIAATTPTGWNDPLEQPVRNWRRSPIYTAPFLAFVPPTTVPAPTMAWVRWPDFAPKARPSTDPQSFAFVPLVPTTSVIADWPDFARRAPQPLDVQSFPWDSIQIATTVTPTGWNDPLEQPVRNWQRSSIYSAPFVALGVPPAQVWFPPNVTPDVVPTRAKPPVNFIPWTFLEPAPQVFFPYDRWPDTAPAAKRVAQNPDWSYGTFVTPTATPTYTQWTQWSDFAPKPKAVVNFQPWSFVPSPAQVFFPYAPWDDFARRKQPPLDTQPLAWNSLQITATVPTMAWVRWPDFAPRARPPTDAPSLAFVPLVPTATVIADWPDFARRKQPPLDTQLFSWSPTQFAVVVPTMVWTNWPDFAERKRQPPTDPQSFVFTPEPSYETVVYDWPDFATRKPQPLDTQPLAWDSIQIAAPTPAPTMAWVQWPDFARAARRAVEFQPFEFVAIPPSGTVIADWPDFATRKPQPLDVQSLPWSTFTPVAAPVVLVPDRWPDFATKKKPAADFVPWTFIPTPRQVFFPYGPWDDFARRRRPLNYDPLAFLQTVRTPWVTMTTWPDFAPIRGKIGLHPAQQQFTARFPDTHFGATVSVTMSAFEINTDGAAAAILVVQSQPAVDAAVSIKEIGILGGSVTP